MHYVYELLDADAMERRARETGVLNQLGGANGVRALFKHYEKLAESIDQPVEIDFVSEARYWSHFSSAIEAAKKRRAPDDWTQTEERALAWLRRRIDVVSIPGNGFLVSS